VYIGQQVTGNVTILCNGLETIKSALLERVTDLQADCKRRLKHIFRMQSLILIAVFINGNWSLSQEPIEEMPASHLYCSANKKFHPVGTVLKRTNRKYRECFVDGPGEQPYWGEEYYPRSRPPLLD